MENPYIELLSVMQRQGKIDRPPGVRLAEVVTPPPNTIIKMGDLQIGKGNILVADYLLPGYQRNTPEDVIMFTDTLKAGNTVVVMPTEDRQTYIILARVVSA